MSDTSNFRGFGPAALKLLSVIAADNTQETFHALKPDYEREVRGPAKDLIVDLNAAFYERGVPLQGTPKRALSRPNRDLRFARDKTPYKTKISIVMTRSGDRHDAGMFFFQLGCENTFAGVGFYVPASPDLAALRTRIAERPDDWRETERDLTHAGLALSREIMAKRLPRGVPPDASPDLLETLRLKSFTVSLPLTDIEVANPRLVDRLADFALHGLPLLRFGWIALGV